MGALRLLFCSTLKFADLWPKYTWARWSISSWGTWTVCVTGATLGDYFLFSKTLREITQPSLNPSFGVPYFQTEHQKKCTLLYCTMQGLCRGDVADAAAGPAGRLRAGHRAHALRQVRHQYRTYQITRQKLLGYIISADSGRFYFFCIEISLNTWPLCFQRQPLHAHNSRYVSPL